MTTITAEAASKALDKAVAEKGTDYVYPDEFRAVGSCRYSDGGAPSCIVGYVIAEIDPELFAQIAEYEDEYGTSLGVCELPGSFDIEFESKDLERALMYAQEAQDDGRAWGGAQSAFYDRLEYVGFS